MLLATPAYTSTVSSAAFTGGANTVTAGGFRIQILWKTLVGGNHFNHVHVGIARA